MRVLLIGLLLLAACSSDVPTSPPSPSFSQTQTIVGSASNGSPLGRQFTTNRTGAVTVTVDWSPKKGGEYFLFVRHFYDPSSIWGYDQSCSAAWDDRVPQTPGHYTCTVADGLPGYWTAWFTPVSGGRISATMTLTAETD